MSWLGPGPIDLGHSRGKNPAIASCVSLLLQTLTKLGWAMQEGDELVLEVVGGDVK